MLLDILVTVNHMRINSTVLIKAPLSDVFQAFTDIENMDKMISGITKVEITSEQKKGTGVIWKETREIFGQQAEQEMGIAQLETDKFYVVESEHANVKYHTRFSFETIGDSTKVDMVFDANPRTFGARIQLFIGNLMGGVMRRMLEQDMQDLKDCISVLIK